MSAQLPDKEQLVKLITQITVEVLNELGQNGTADAATSAKPCNLDSSDCAECGYCVAKKPEVIESYIDSGATRFTSQLHTPPVSQSLGKYIDHTLLKPEATPEELRKICEEALKYQFKSVCVNPAHVPFCVKMLEGSSVGVTAVVGFPLGATTARVKAFETEEAVKNGATEIDMVINVTSLRSKNYAAVYHDIAQVVRAAHGAPVKVILETGLLNQNEKIAGCVLSKAAGASFVKTSTGFGKGGATYDDIKLMREIVGAELGVKASGGIRDSETAQKMIEAGATRLGASASVAIVRGDKATGTGY